MKLVDLICPVCGWVKEDIRIEDVDTWFCTGETPRGGKRHKFVKMNRIFLGINYRIINYSPEYAGGNDK